MPPTFLALLILGCSPDEPRDTTTDTYDPNAPIAERCFGDLGPDAILGDYDALGAVVPRHCQGTDHQDIADIGRVVFLGDSITAGTPPTPPEEYYRELLVADLEARFGPLAVQDCSRWGARIDDLLRDENQIETCFPGPVDERTLVVFTIGGNDMVAWGQDLAAGQTREEVQVEFDAYMGLMEDAVSWFSEHEASHFPAGVDVIFANVYEYTDGTNEVDVCPLAGMFDVPSGVQEFREGYVLINETFIDIAVRTGTDAVFLFEQFCGHGFFNDDPNNPCYRGPDAERWFDDTCIHPTPAGHRKLADMILAVVDE